VYKKHTYTYLIFAFAFYLAAQAFQQYVLLAGPAANIRILHESILVSQDPLNLVRHGLIYASMFLILPALVILARHYLPIHKGFSWLAAVCFCLFCLIEIGYRTVYVFLLLGVEFKAYAAASAADQALLLSKFQTYFATIDVVYIPLLLALMLGSLFLMLASIKTGTVIVTVAMAISVIQNASRLAGYTPLKSLNVFTGFWYFVPVALTFGLLIIAAVRFGRSQHIAGT
jgi:hypothetical protein